jgi:hypothetical protein
MENESRRRTGRVGPATKRPSEMQTRAVMNLRHNGHASTREASSQCKHTWPQGSSSASGNGELSMQATQVSDWNWPRISLIAVCTTVLRANALRSSSARALSPASQGWGAALSAGCTARPSSASEAWLRSKDSRGSAERTGGGSTVDPATRLATEAASTVQ